MLRISAVAALLCALASPTIAATFNDRASFLAAGGTYKDHTNIKGDFALTNGPSASALIGDNTYTNKFPPNQYIILSGVENFNLDVTYTTTIFAFGMDIYEPTSSVTFNGCNVTPCVESTFSISFLDGTTVLDTLVISPDNDVLDFIGYSNASGFDRVEVRETTGTHDNEMFGNLVSSSTALAPVPLPAGGALLLGGLGMLALRRKAAKS